MKAVIDRFEETFAVVLAGEQEIRVDIPRKLLPAGSREGSWLDFSISLDPEGEHRQRDKIQNMLDRLKQKKP